MLPAEFLGAVGLDFATLPKAGPNVGAGGTAPALCKGTLTYEGIVICDEFMIAEAGALPFAILGREDFFKKFVLRFNWHKTPPEFHVDPVVVAKKGRR